jgi:hypothetical protein
VPALSQNFEFVVNGTTTTSVVYPVTTTTAQIFTSTDIKAANYYGINNNLQTVEIKLTEFVGTVTLQATLAAEPAEMDWFAVNLQSQDYTVDTTGLSSRVYKKQVSYNVATTKTEVYNFEGNYVWLRGRISEFTAGTVNGITVNY